MTQIVIRVDGLEFHASSWTDEPRCLDLDVARVAGLSDPHKIRAAIRTAVADGLLVDDDAKVVSALSAENRRRGRPGTAYALTLMGARLIATRMRTPDAVSFVRRMVGIYAHAAEAFRTTEPPETAEVVSGFHAVLAACQTVGHNPLWKSEIFQRIGFIAYRNKDTWTRVHGALRKHLGVVGYLRIPAGMLDETRRHLDGLASGALLLPRKAAKLKLVPNPKQQPLPFVGKH